MADQVGAEHDLLKNEGLKAVYGIIGADGKPSDEPILLGQGGFGKVYRAVDAVRGHELALKVCSTSSKGKGEEARMTLERLFVKEGSTQRSLSHPGIVQLLSGYKTKDAVYLGLELCEGGDVLSEVERSTFGEEEAKAVVLQTATALAYMHENGVVHRDLKLENILLCNSRDSLEPMRSKIADFTLAARTRRENGLTDVCGSLLYVAPEILAVRAEGVEGRRVGYGSPVDVWSLGVSMYIMLAGEAPFAKEGSSLPDVRRILRGDYTLDLPCFWALSQQGRSLLEAMLRIDPAERITAAGVLRHPWFHMHPSREPGRSRPSSRRGSGECDTEGWVAQGVPAHLEMVPHPALDSIQGALVAAALAAKRTRDRAYHARVLKGRNSFSMQYYNRRRSHGDSMSIPPAQENPKA